MRFANRSEGDKERKIGRPGRLNGPFGGRVYDFWASGWFHTHTQCIYTFGGAKINQLDLIEEAKVSLASYSFAAGICLGHCEAKATRQTSIVLATTQTNQNQFGLLELRGERNWRREKRGKGGGERCQ